MRRKNSRLDVDVMVMKDVVLSENTLYVAVNMNHLNARELIASFNRELKLIHNNGTHQRLKLKYKLN